MLVTLLNWIYILIITYILGAFMLPKIAKLINNKSEMEFNYSDFIVTGLIISTVYAQFFSLITGVNLVANLIIIAVCIVFVVLDRKKLGSLFSKRQHGSKWEIIINILALILFLIFFVLSIMFTAEGTFHYDTGLYHAQAIHWIEDYGVIKGLGYIHVRLAYNSAYFPLNALFSMRDIFGQSLHSVSGFISILMCSYSVFGWYKSFINKTFLRKTAMSDMLRLAPVFYFAVCLLEITSPESDYITINFIIWTLIRFVELFEQNQEDGETCKENLLTGLCLLSVCAFAMIGYKLSAATIVLIAIWPIVALIKKKRWFSILICAILCMLVILPYLIRNVIICGWLIYPVDFIDLFNVPWKFAKSTLSNDAGEIGNWAKAMEDAQGTASGFGWILSWWDAQNLAARLFMSSMLMSLPVMVISWFDRKKALIKYLMIVLVGTLVFYLFKAPLIRYCYGPVLVIPLLVMGYCLNRSYEIAAKKENTAGAKRIVSFLPAVFSIIVSLIILFPSAKSMKALMKFDYEEANGRFSFGDYIISQVDYPHADVREIDWYGNTVYLPAEEGKDQCWYDAFPSSPYHEAFDNTKPSTGNLKDGVELIK